MTACMHASMYNNLLKRLLLGTAATNRHRAHHFLLSSIGLVVQTRRQLDSQAAPQQLL